MKRNDVLKALLGGAFIVAFACTCSAQEAAPAASSSAAGTTSGSHMGSQDGYLQVLALALGLTDTQVGQIKTIFQTGSGQFKAIRDDSSLPEDQKLAQIKALKETTDQQFKAVLTPEQQQKLTNLVQRFLDHRADTTGNHR